MANSISFPMVLHRNKLVSNMPLFVARARKSHNPRVHCKNLCKRTFLKQSLIRKSFISGQRSLSLVPLNAKSREPGEEENKALETVLKLYSAIKNQNIHEISNIIGDECRCICNFFSYFQLFQGKQQVLEFFNYVMENLGKNIGFVVEPTLQDGMNVGVSWKLEWRKTHMPLGKGFSFYNCHVYQGKLLIRNVEMFMEPLLHIEPFRLKITGYFMRTLEKISSCHFAKERVTKAILGLIIMALILLFMKPSLY